MLLDDVRHALEAQADAVPLGRIEPPVVLARAERTVRRRRRVRAAAVVSALAAIVIATVAVVGASTAPNDTITAISGPATTAVARPSSPFTAAQLRAHEGAGVPAGWAPADSGNARLFVPGDWILENGDSCIGDPSAPGMVRVGKLAQAGCGPPSQWPIPAQAVSIIAATGQPTGSLVQTVHGYRIYRASRHAVWTFYVVPQLEAEIAIRGTLSGRILATLAPSAREVALEFAQHVPPVGNVVMTDGMRITIPRSWSVETPVGLGCTWFSSEPGSRPELLRIRPGIGMPGCPFQVPHVASFGGDGVRLQTATDRATTTPPSGRRPIVVLHHGLTTVRVYTDGTMLDLYVQRAGSTTTHLLYLGLGRDGRIAGGILASIEATS